MMRLVLAALAVIFLLPLASCSSGKTRLDCISDCKTRGLPWTGILSRNVRTDDRGEEEITETCRCGIETPL